MSDAPVQDLTDNEVHDRLVAAVSALGSAPAANLRGQAALDTARRVLTILQFALLKAAEDGADMLPGVQPPDA